MANIYFFDPLAALEVAKQNLSVETHLQTNPKQICFYNGEPNINMPSNCISVPINDFYNYFFTTSHTLPQQINFDNLNFDDATKNEITQGIVATLTQVQNDRVQITIKILQAPLETTTVHNYITILLDYLEFIDAKPETVEREIIEKLLDFSQFSLLHQLEVEATLLEKITAFYQHFYKHYHAKITTNIKIMHLDYALQTLITQDTKESLYFSNLILLLNDLPAHINDYALVTHVYNESRLSQYLAQMAQALFNDDFIHQNLLTQKSAIYKYYYLTNSHYGRGKSYQEMYATLYPIFLQAIEHQQDELAFYLYTPLFMSWVGTTQTQEEFKKFNDEVERPLESFIINTLIHKYQLQPNLRKIDKSKPIKVAFLQERIINHSVNKVFISLLETLTKEPNAHYEFIVYDLNFMEFGGSDSEAVKALKALDVTYVDLYESCSKQSHVFYPIVEKALNIRQHIINDNIDILIGMNTRPEYNFLFTTRTAPRQIYWSHGNFEYNLDNIDVSATHNLVPEKYNFKTFSIPMDTREYTPNIDAKALKQLREKFPSNAFILGTIGRLIKLDDDAYLESVARIMHENPKTIYLACGSGEKSSLESKIKAYGLQERFYFPGHVDAHLYAYLIDLWLEPFKMQSGESLNEFMYKKRSYINLWETWSEEEKSTSEYQTYSQYVLPDTQDNYIACASKLIQEPEFKRSILEKHYKQLCKLNHNITRFLNLLES